MGCKKCEQVFKISVPKYGGILYEDELWIVVHKGDPVGVEGHLQLVAKRHFQGPSDMTDAEAATVGLILRHCEHILQQVTGASNIYTAALGSQYPHFHVHMVPVSKGTVMPEQGVEWDTFLQEKLAADGKLSVSDPKCAEIANKFKRQMMKTPPQYTYHEQSRLRPGWFVAWWHRLFLA
mmetsp:Transcript_1231/g.2161  ORF Transcript_1231/g.2161 Transcript_1231/m.2161 type:complete len:179 (+) Transcript_1231:80-616(+)